MYQMRRCVLYSDSHFAVWPGKLPNKPCWIVGPGSDSRNKRPYCLVVSRLSNTTTTPRSVWVRIRRPNPCLKRKIASQVYSLKGSSKLSERRRISGRSAVKAVQNHHHRKRFPSTSTPLQNARVPNSTALGVS